MTKDTDMEQQIGKSVSSGTKQKTNFSQLAQRIGQKINDLFKPEEVEVTIEGTGYYKTYKVSKPANR